MGTRVNHQHPAPAAAASDVVPSQRRQGGRVAALAALLGVALFGGGIAVGWSVASETSEPDPTTAVAVEDLTPLLRECASDGADHPIGDCDLVADEVLAALTAIVAGDPRAAGHRQRYITALAEHYARTECAANPTNPQSLCRLDYLDLAVMADQARPAPQ